MRPKVLLRLDDVQKDNGMEVSSLLAKYSSVKERNWPIESGNVDKLLSFIFKTVSFDNLAIRESNFLRAMPLIVSEVRLEGKPFIVG